MYVYFFDEVWEDDIRGSTTNASSGGFVSLFHRTIKPNSCDVPYFSIGVIGMILDMFKVFPLLGLSKYWSRKFAFFYSNSKLRKRC